MELKSVIWRLRRERLFASIINMIRVEFIRLCSSWLVTLQFQQKLSMYIKVSVQWYSVFSDFYFDLKLLPAPFAYFVSCYSWVFSHDFSTSERLILIDTLSQQECLSKWQTSHTSEWISHTEFSITAHLQRLLAIVIIFHVWKVCPCY